MASNKIIVAPSILAADFSNLAGEVHAIEKAGGFNGKGSPEAFDFTTHRLAAGSQMLLNLWYTAWIESATSVEVR